MDAPTIIVGAVSTALQAVGLYILQHLRTRIVRLEDLYIRNENSAHHLPTLEHATPRWRNPRRKHRHQ